MKELKIVKYVLMGISVLTVLVFFVGLTDVDLMLRWAYILIGAAALCAIVFPVINMIRNPKGAKNTLIGLGLVILVLGVSLALSSTTPVTDSAGGVFNDPLVLRLSDTGIYATYFALAAAILVAVVGEVSKIFK